MNKLVLVVVGALFSVNIVHAQTTASPAANVAATSGASSCEAKAVGKNGKLLAGAAKSAFMKKCEASAPSADKASACAAKAVDKKGKPLAGAAKSSFMKKCEATN
jgi:hypothetical protein